MQNHINDPRDATMAFGDVPASYGDLIILGTAHVFSRFLYEAFLLDKDVTLRFGQNAGDRELNIPALSSKTYDELYHNGIIQIKHNGAAPTAGIIQVTSWGVP